MKRETLNLVVSPVIVVNSGGPNLLWWTQATMAMALATSDGHPLRGRRQHRATQSEGEQTRLVIEFWADEVGKEEYGANLESKLKELSERLGGMGYRPQPVKRVYIPKPGTTKQRPLGMQCFEDKLVQVGLGRVLEQIYEADFVESSFGYRPGRTQHQALDQAQPLKERRTLASGQTETGRASELLRHHGQLGNVQRVQNRGDAAFVPLAEPAKSETELRLGAVQ